MICLGIAQLVSHEKQFGATLTLGVETNVSDGYPGSDYYDVSCGQCT